MRVIVIGGGAEGLAAAEIMAKEADVEKVILADISQKRAEKNATIAKAEGEKQVQILHAEGLSIYYKKLAELGEGAQTVLKFESIAALKKFGYPCQVDPWVFRYRGSFAFLLSGSNPALCINIR